MINKRKYNRVNVSIPVIVYDILNDRTIFGRIFDISEGGVGMSLNEKLEVHTPVSLEFELIPSVLWTQVPADIVNVRNTQSDNYHIGAVFHNARPEIIDEIRKYVNKNIGRITRSLHRSGY